MKFDYFDKVFVITGAAGGIGSHLAKEVASQNAKVVALDINQNKLDQLINSLPGNDHLAICFDLTDKSEMKKAIDQIASKYGRIDVLVNNAAITSAERFDERSLESIEQELSINLLSPLLFMRLAIDLLKKSKDPRIISTVSLGGIFPLGETPIYTTSKFGLRGAMLSLSLDLEKKGIKVSSILPSATDTAMLHKEAIEGGNTLQFLDPPQTTDDVIKSFKKTLDNPKFERYPKPSESWLVRIVMLVPDLLPKLMPLFVGRGNKGHKKYLKELENRGTIKLINGKYELND
ncbi:MAG: SDR family NAD(P)-dependent oxidoreductase [Candidatus Nanopelagicales bacterium]